MSVRSRGIGLCLLLAGAQTAWLGACSTVFRHEAAATPQRPSFSSDPSTTAERTAEVELGGTFDPDDFIDFPTTLKFGTGPRTEVFLSWSPLVIIDVPGPDEEGESDLLLGTRHRFLESSGADAAVQLALKIPQDDDEDEFTTGEIDGFLATTLGGRAGATSWTGFYELGILGDPGEGVADVRHGLALALSRSIAEGPTGFGELAFIDVADRKDDEAIFMTLGIQVPFLPSLIGDAAIVVGLSDDAPDFQLLLGFTDNLGRIFQSTPARPHE